MTPNEKTSNKKDRLRYVGENNKFGRRYTEFSVEWTHSRIYNFNLDLLSCLLLPQMSGTVQLLYSTIAVFSLSRSDPS